MGLFRYNLVWSKVWYFETFATSALLLPLLNLYLRRRGLSEAQIGVVAALRPWVSAVAGNFWAGLGDATGAHKKILILTYVLTVVLRYCIGLAPSFLLVAVFVAFAEAMSAPILILADASSMAAGKTEGDYGRARMWGAAGWGMFSPIAGLIVSNLGSHALFEANLIGGVLGLLPTAMLPTFALQHKGQRHGQQIMHEEGYEEGLGLTAETDIDGADRLGRIPITRYADKTQGNHYSTAQIAEDVGTSEAAAWRAEPFPEDLHSVEASSTGSQKEESLLRDLEGLLPISAAPETIDYGPQLAMNGNAAESPGASRADNVPELAAEPQQMSIWHRLKQIFSNPEVDIFFTMTVLYGFAAGCIDGYVFLFLDQLGAPELLMGLTITVACIIELPVFHFMGRILKFVGVEEMLHWVLFFFLVRLGCYTFLGHFPSPWLILPVETLNGITFGCAWAAGTVNCSRIAPQGLEATTQAIFSGLYMGFGLGLGGLFGGIVYNTKGPAATFAGAFTVVLVGWILCACAQQLVRCVKRRGVRREAKKAELQSPLLSTDQDSA